MSTPKIFPSLWYAKEVEQAAKFYASVFPESKIEKVWTLPVESPSGPPGSVKLVELTLCGQHFSLMEAGPHHDFNDAISFTVNCNSQAEIDKYWNAILENGGTPQACGWITDRWGVRWQIVPANLVKLMTDPDPAKAKRVATEILNEVKFDVAKLEAAARG
jgi:predicted 3-demethylubiquinone-9 3-methyltransferase (glyoxalase superfamily)